MTTINLWAAGVGAAALGAAAYGAAPASSSGPVATYWMDVSTQSGLGAGMAAGGRPSMSQILAMMNGGGGGVTHTLQLRLASKDKAASPEAQHWIPAALQMGSSLPLLSPVVERVAESSAPAEAGGSDKPKGRMLIYWGCGEHSAAGEPMVIDFAKLASGQVPANLEALAKMGRTMGRTHGPEAGNSPGFGEWPNRQDSRPVPASGSLVGAHRIEANYAPPISFTLGAGEDFMPGLGLTDAGALASGAERLEWQPAAQATGYALAMFGSSGNGDIIIWTSAKAAAMAPAFDYLAPAEVKRLVAAGAVLAPSTSQCTLPAEVASAVPAGMVMEVGYGPEASFSDSPRSPKWAAHVRFKTSAMLMRGIGGAGAGSDNESAEQQRQQAQPQPAPVKKRRGLGLGDLIGAIPH